MDINRYVDLQSNSLIRLVSAAAGISLIAASGVLLLEAQNHPKPIFQVPAVLVTVGLSALVLRASSFAVFGRRVTALSCWSVCAILLISLPILQVLPIEYSTPALLDLKALAPALWQYTLSIPLLLFLLFETAIPVLRYNHTSNIFLVTGLSAAIMFLFFTTALIGDIANTSMLIHIPHRMFLSVITPIGISILIVLAIVLIRKGMVGMGVLSLLMIGLGIEWMSTWSYDGPHFLADTAQIPFDNYPMLPVLAGTIPGALAALAGVMAGWEVYVNNGADQMNDLSG